MSPPRLHVITSTGRPKALIVRRGPSDMVSTILWDRQTHTFELGQWLKGRIFEHRSDLSPDGRHMICFAGNGRRWWTAVSRAPWLTALLFLPQDNTWFGGGAFTDTGGVWLNGGDPQEAALPDGLKPAATDAFPHATDGFHTGDLFVTGMRMRGWDDGEGQGYDTVLYRQIAPALRLRLTFSVGAEDRALISNSYALHRGSAHQQQPAWEWADLWGDSVQFAMKGALFQADIAEDRLGPARRLRDFNAMKFKPRSAPSRGVDEPGT